MASPAETQRILTECRAPPSSSRDVDSQVWAQAARTGSSFNARLARLRAAKGDRFMIEYYELLAGDDIVAFKFVRP
jgi:hypothetical protein